MDGSDKLNKRSPKQAAALVILVIMAMVLSFVEISLIPNAPWLKYDPSGVIAILAALLFGPVTGSSVALLAWIPRLIANPLGSFMNILSSLCVVIVVGLMYRHKPTLKGAVVGVLVGSLCSVVVSIVLNFVVLPLYQPTLFNEILDMVVPALLPFNVAKSLINSGIALIAYRKLEALLAEDPPPVE